MGPPIEMFSISCLPISLEIGFVLKLALDLGNQSRITLGSSLHLERTQRTYCLIRTLFEIQSQFLFLFFEATKIIANHFNQTTFGYPPATI